MIKVIITFLVVATVFAIGTIIYVILDILLSPRKREEPVEEPAPAPTVIVPEPIPEPVPIVVPVIVDHVDAEEANALLSDSDAIELAEYEECGNEGKQGIINLGVVSMVFEPNAVVTLEALKELKLIPKKVQRVKILADGILDKPLTVKAESFSVEAMKMIELTGGKVVILRTPEQLERLKARRERERLLNLS